MQKTLIISLIGSLMLITSGFCVSALIHTQELTAGWDMERAQAHSIAPEQMLAEGDSVQMISSPESNTLGSCLPECISPVPEALITKQDLKKIGDNLVALERLPGVPMSPEATESPGQRIVQLASRDLSLSVQKRE